MSASDEHRLVALRLHGLADSDRRWILSRLADGDRIKLEGYLEELKGFQLDPETLAELQQRISVPTAAAAPRPASKGAPDHVIEQVLSAEPLWLSRLLHPESSDHRIGDAESVVMPRVREVAEAVFKRQVSSMRKKRKLVDVRPDEYQGHVVPAGSILTRLRDVWRR